MIAGCSIDALLGSDKVCLLVQKNSKTDLKFMRFIAVICV